MVAGQAATPYDVTGTALLTTDADSNESAIILLSTDTQPVPTCEQLASPSGSLDSANKLTMVAFGLAAFKPAPGKYAVSSVSLVKATKGADPSVAATQATGLSLDVQSFEGGVLTANLGGAGDAKATGTLIARSCPIGHSGNTATDDSPASTTTTSAMPPDEPSATATKSGASVGTEAPELETEKVSLSSLKGKVVVVTFWATWCVPCTKSFPKLQALRAKYKDRGLVVVGVAEDDDAGGIESFAKKHGASFPLVFDKQKKIAGKWQPKSMPMTYVLDRKGVVQNVFVSYHDGDEKDLEAAVKKLF